MHIIIVHLHIKPEHVEAFRAATIDNARNSLQEPGVVRFDLLQQLDDPTRFVLHEVYHSADGLAQHRDTAHYLRWRDAVADMMAEPRTRAEYANVFPAAY